MIHFPFVSLSSILEKTLHMDLFDFSAAKPAESIALRVGLDLEELLLASINPKEIPTEAMNSYEQRVRQLVRSLGDNIKDNPSLIESVIAPLVVRLKGTVPDEELAQRITTLRITLEKGV